MDRVTMTNSSFVAFRELDFMSSNVRDSVMCKGRWMEHLASVDGWSSTYFKIYI